MLMVSIPLLWLVGLDTGGGTAFSVGIELPSQVPVTAAVENALRDMGIDHFNTYVTATDVPPAIPAEEVNVAMRALADRLGVDYALACHHIDPPASCVRAAAEDAKGRFLGTVFDELAHARLLNHFSPEPLADYDGFMTLQQAYEETLAGYTALHDTFAELGSPVVATHVWPVLLHLAARAGFTPCPKICKEFYSPVSLAIGLGAAKQYGRELWVDCDLWFWDLVPGHTPEEFRSNLLLAYWMGADRVYVEGSGHNLTPPGHQGVPFSLMTPVTDTTYRLTPHGEVLRWFCREYVPSHPRAWTFRDIQPTSAVIRFEDTCHGQRFTPGFADQLYGSARLASTPDTEAWLGLWNQLTCGRTGSDGLSYFKSWTALAGYERAVEPGLQPSYLTRPVQADQHRFFVPLSGVVVYDHTAQYEQLAGVPFLFLTGTQVSETTLDAVRRCIDEGATCVAWGPLARACGLSDWEAGTTVEARGQGRLVATDDFRGARVYEHMWPAMGRPDEIRYRFTQGEVVLRRVTDNRVGVEVTAFQTD